MGRHWGSFPFDDKNRRLAAQPTPGTAAHIPVTVRYVDVGEAQRGTILLMHGIPTWGYLYHAIIPPLVHSGYQVLAPDFLGHGWSDRRDRFDRSFQVQARMNSALLWTLELERVDVVGHDTGGAVALILAIEHAQRVNRLIISNSVRYDRFDDDMLDFGHPPCGGNPALSQIWSRRSKRAWQRVSRTAADSLLSSGKYETLVSQVPASSHTKIIASPAGSAAGRPRAPGRS